MCLSRSKVKSEETVNAVISMMDACVRVCAGSVKYQNRMISEEELLERVSLESLMYCRWDVVW